MIIMKYIFFPECGYISTYTPVYTSSPCDIILLQPLSLNIPTAHLPHYIYTLLPPCDNRDVGAQIYREHEISQGSHNNDPARHETALVFLSVINFVTSDGVTKEGRGAAIYVAASQRISEFYLSIGELVFEINGKLKILTDVSNLLYVIEELDAPRAESMKIILNWKFQVFTVTATLLGLLDPKNESITFTRNIGNYLLIDTA
jgi:hypothetical protein